MRSLDVSVQRFQRVETSELRNPSVPQLTDIRSRVTGERRQQLLVRGKPWNLLHAQVDIWILTPKLIEHFADYFDFRPDSPEFKFRPRMVVRSATHEDSDGHAENAKMRKSKCELLCVE